MGRSVFAVDRGLWSDPDFADEAFSEREAWVWIIGAAAWRESRVRGNAHPVTLVRGEFSFSVRFLAEKFQWTKDKTHRFIKALQRRDMIRDTKRDGSQVYSIKNYNQFQVVGLPKRDSDKDAVETPPATEARHERDKEETLKQVNSNKQEEPAPSAPLTEKLKPVIPKPLPDWVNPDTWAAFVAMRKLKRKPMTPQAHNLIVGDLERFFHKGHDPTAILNASIRNSWTDVYEPKAETNGQRNNEKRRTSTDEHLDGIASLIGDIRAGNARS